MTRSDNDFQLQRKCESCLVSLIDLPQLQFTIKLKPWFTTEHPSRLDCYIDNMTKQFDSYWWHKDYHSNAADMLFETDSYFWEIN